ncbi:hypothetical protein BGX27_005102 [Mortierella sp. AM989]|nr:hypothetical protein BGX27_005102 [Mortierella sp. AM989]
MASSQKNYQRPNLVENGCKTYDNWTDASMGTFPPQYDQPMSATGPFRQHDGPLPNYDLDALANLHSVIPEVSLLEMGGWPCDFGQPFLPSCPSTNFGNYNLSYPSTTTPTAVSPAEPYHSYIDTNHHANLETLATLSQAYSPSQSSPLSHSQYESDSDDSSYTSFPSSPSNPSSPSSPEPTMPTKYKYKAKYMSRARRVKESRPLRTFECDYEGCSKHFSRQFNLDQHAKTHSDDRPYICEREKCAKAFIRRADLVRHTRTHTGETPFKCQFGCNDVFSRTEARQRHYLKSHHAKYVKSEEYAKRLDRQRKDSEY